VIPNRAGLLLRFHCKMAEESYDKHDHISDSQASCPNPNSYYASSFSSFASSEWTNKPFSKANTGQKR
jgi:hypothetical protein